MVEEYLAELNQNSKLDILIYYTKDPGPSHLTMMIARKIMTFIERGQYLALVYLERRIVFFGND